MAGSGLDGTVRTLPRGVKPESIQAANFSALARRSMMSHRTVLSFVLLAVLVGGTQGCTTIQAGSSNTLPSSAFFPVDANELKSLQAIAHAQDSRMKNCHKGPACEDAYYTRGLVALFENRAD